MKNTFMMYMIGRSGSGKTTIANAVEKLCHSMQDIRIQVLDGDIIREKFGGIFGYTYEERMKANQAARVVAEYLVNNGVSVILTQVAAYEEMRQKTREHFQDKYIEVYVKCSFEECARRDVKGYYKKSQLGQMSNLNGADDIYEEPQNSHIVIDTEKVNLEEAANQIISYIQMRYE